MKFESGELVIVNGHAISGLPNRIGEIAEVLNSMSSPNYDYVVRFEDNSIAPVKETEMNHLTMPELDLITYIKRGNKVLYAPMNKEVEIVKVDYLHGQAEVEFDDKSSMVLGFESLRPIEQKEGEKVKEYKFQIGDRVKIHSDDDWNGSIGEVSGVQYYDEGYHEYLVDIEDKVGCPFTESELQLATEEDKTKAYHLDLFFGHYENEDGSFTLPRQLLHNLLDKLI